ncbi:MAG TPA: hypothetical protein VMV63_03035 [Acidithiobacillus sp.]|nr:hypothetical protein [Acidithiobacillus sp.]
MGVLPSHWAHTGNPAPIAAPQPVPAQAAPGCNHGGWRCQRADPFRGQPWRNRLRVRWIPVAFVRPDSLGMAVSILYAAHPRQTLDLNEGHYDFRTRRGGMLPAFQIPPAQAAAIRGNTALWRRVFGVTPMILYPSATGMRGLFSLPNPQQLRMVFQAGRQQKELQRHEDHHCIPDMPPKGCIKQPASGSMLRRNDDAGAGVLGDHFSDAGLHGRQSRVGSRFFRWHRLFRLRRFGHCAPADMCSSQTNACCAPRQTARPRHKCT